MVMKRLTFLMLFLAFTGFLQAQEIENSVTKGDILRLGTPSGATYQHLDFPRKNIIIKRGAIADFNNLIGKQLIVENWITNEDGFTEVILRRDDGLNFFRFYPTVKANLENALAKGELKITENKKEDFK